MPSSLKSRFISPSPSTTSWRTAPASRRPTWKLGPGHQLRDIVVNLAAECGANLRYDYEGTSLDTLREMMATGLGVSLMPGLYVRSVVSKDPRFKTYDIGSRGLSRTIGMLWRKTKNPQHNFDNLAVLIRNIVTDEFGANRANTPAEPVA